MKDKSILKNTIIYTIRILSSMIFPLITFPYISRVLSPDGIGAYNFSNSVISYFSLLAGLGISTYAIREGAKVRDDRLKLEELAQELFTINLISTVFSYILFLTVVNIIPQFVEYKSLLFILSFTLPLSTLGTEWIFSIFEDYFYITIRSISFQLISLILMILLVKNRSDVNTYAIITVFANAGSNIFNYMYAKRYFKHKIVFENKILKHIKPIFILFAAAIASQIYINSDTTMLGFLKGNRDVGIYAAATKIYNILRSLLTAFITVIVPRLNYCYKKRNKDNSYQKLFKDSLNYYMAVIIPASIGIFLISRVIIVILSGNEYISAEISLKILSIALIFSTTGSFIANCALIVSGQDKNILIATVIGAMVNLCLNFIFIPLFSYNGAAFTTLIAEFIVFNIQLYFSRNIIKIKQYITLSIKPIIASIPMFVFSILLHLLELNYILELILTIVVAVISYGYILFVMKHEIIGTVITAIKRKYIHDKM